jgi:serine/threonine protein kinase
VWFYIVMDIYGKTVFDHSEYFQLSLNTVLQIGIQAIDRLKVIHESDLVHTDIKPDNLTLGSFEDEHGSKFVNIIDFGRARKYKDSAGNHVRETDYFLFEGNALICSESQLSHKLPTRRDDLMCLGLSMFFLLRALPYTSFYS